MVIYSKYENVKKFKILQLKNKIAHKKTKKNKNKYDIYNPNLTKKKIYTKTKRYLIPNRKQTNKKTPKYINLNKTLDGGFFFNTCGIPNYSKIDNKFKKLNDKFTNVVNKNTTYVNSIELKLDKLKSLYATLFFIKKKIFVYTKQQALLDSTTPESSPINSNIRNIKASIGTITSTIEIINDDYKTILKNLKNATSNFNDIKKKFNNEFNEYIITEGKPMKKKQKTFNFKMIKIQQQLSDYNDKVKNKINPKDLDKNILKIYNKVKKCKPKYDKANEFYDNFIKTISNKEHSADVIMNKIEHLKKYMEDTSKEYDKNTTKFPNWESNAILIYDILETLVGTNSLTLPARTNGIKIPSYEDLKHPLVRIRDLLKQSALVTINKNMVIEMGFVIDFIDKIIAAQKAIKKDIAKIKSDFIDYKSGEYLKTIITEIIMTHNNNIQNLSIIKYHLENITNDKADAISIFTQMNTFPEIMGSQKAITHRSILGVDSGTSTIIAGGANLENVSNIQKGGGPSPSTAFNFELNSSDINSVNDLHFRFEFGKNDNNTNHIYKHIIKSTLGGNYIKILNKFIDKLKLLVNFATTVTQFYQNNRNNTNEVAKKITETPASGGGTPPPTSFKLKHHKKVTDLTFSNYKGRNDYNNYRNYISTYLDLLNDYNIKNIVDKILNNKHIDVDKSMDFKQTIIEEEINNTGSILKYMKDIKIIDELDTSFNEETKELPDISKADYDIVLPIFNAYPDDKFDIVGIDTIDNSTLTHGNDHQTKIYDILLNRIKQRKEMYIEIDNWKNKISGYKNDFYVILQKNHFVIENFKNDYINALNEKFN